MLFVKISIDFYKKIIAFFDKFKLLHINLKVVKTLLANLAVLIKNLFKIQFFKFFTNNSLILNLKPKYSHYILSIIKLTLYINALQGKCATDFNL